VVEVGREVVAAESGDVGALVRLSSALFREDAGIRDPYTDVGWPRRHGRDHFLSLISHKDALCLLAKSGSKPVGYLAGYVGEPTTVRPVKVAELQSMYVEARDRGRGGGSALVAEFLSWAGVRAAERVAVTAYASNGDALGFYARRGFRPRSITLEMSPKRGGP
jgi:ribosomal protein S18 acetylase RimI-like enzyme